MSSADGLEAEESDEEDGGEGRGHKHGEGKEVAPAELWDLLRPLIGDCELRLLKFEDKEAQVCIAQGLLLKHTPYTVVLEAQVWWFYLPSGFVVPVFLSPVTCVSLGLLKDNIFITVFRSMCVLQSPGPPRRPWFSLGLLSRDPT